MISPLAPRRPIYLVRHARSEWNGTRRISGQQNPPLAAEGVAHAACLARALREVPIEAVYSSTLQRSVDTARPAAEERGLPVRRREALRELCCGILEGRVRDTSDPEALALWEAWSRDRVSSRLPGGESYEDLAARVAPCLEEILGSGECALVVGHRRTNAVILALLMGWPLEEAARLRLRARYLYELTAGEEGGPRIRTRALRADRTEPFFDGFTE